MGSTSLTLSPSPSTTQPGEVDSTILSIPPNSSGTVPPLAGTGGPSPVGMTLALGLLALGSGLVFASRRRVGGRHS